MKQDSLRCLTTPQPGPLCSSLPRSQTSCSTTYLVTHLHSQTHYKFFRASHPLYHFTQSLDTLTFLSSSDCAQQPQCHFHYYSHVPSLPSLLGWAYPGFPHPLTTSPYPTIFVQSLPTCRRPKYRPCKSVPLCPLITYDRPLAYPLRSTIFDKKDVKGIFSAPPAL